MSAVKKRAAPGVRAAAERNLNAARASLEDAVAARTNMMAEAGRSYENDVYVSASADAHVWAALVAKYFESVSASVDYDGKAEGKLRLRPRDNNDALKDARTALGFSEPRHVPAEARHRTRWLTEQTNLVKEAETRLTSPVYAGEFPSAVVLLAFLDGLRAR